MNLITTYKASLVLGMTPDAVRYHEKAGHIVALRVDQGPRGPMRLFVLEDVERFHRERLAKQAAGEHRE